MRLDLFLLADHAVSAPDNKLYINGGGIGKLTAPGLPFAIPYISLVLRFAYEPGEVGDHTLSIRLVSPDGVELLPTDPQPVHVNPDAGGVVDGEEAYFQAVASFGGVPIVAAGIHRIIVTLDGEIVREFRLPVAVQAPAEGQTPEVS